MRIATIDGSEYEVDDEVFEYICRLELEINTLKIEKGRYKDMIEIKKQQVEELEEEVERLKEENDQLLANDDANCEIQRQLKAEVVRLLEIAKAAGAWKDKNGTWVCGGDKVICDHHSIDIEYRAGEIEPELRKYYYLKEASDG